MGTKRKWSPRKFREALAAMPGTGMSVPAFRRALCAFLQPPPSPQYIHREWLADSGRGPSSARQVAAAARVLGVKTKDLMEDE